MPKQRQDPRELQRRSGQQRPTGAQGQKLQTRIAFLRGTRRRLSISVSTRAISVFGTQDLETEGAACQTLGSTGDEVRRADEEARNILSTGRHSRTDVNLARHRRGALITPDRSRRGRSRRDRAAGRGKSEARGRRSENTEGQPSGHLRKRSSRSPQSKWIGKRNDGARKGERRTTEEQRKAKQKTDISQTPQVGK